MGRIAALLLVAGCTRSPRREAEPAAPAPEPAPEAAAPAPAPARAPAPALETPGDLPTQAAGEGYGGDPGSPPNPQTTDRDDPRIPFGDTERLYAGMSEAKNPVEWRVGGRQLLLATLISDEDPQGKIDGWLIAMDGGVRTNVERWKVYRGGAHWVEIKPQQDGTAVLRWSTLRHSGSQGDSHARLLRWNAGARRLEVTARWDGGGGDRLPPWAAVR